MKRTFVCTRVILMCLLGAGAAQAQRVQEPAAEPEAARAQRPAAGPSAGVPRLIKFSGVLRDRPAQGLAGPVGVAFAVYREQEGGAALWLETQNVEADEQGRFTVILGATKSDGIPLEIFASAEPRWLGIQVAGQAEQPRVLLVSVPYALKAADADALGGKPASAYVLAKPDSHASTATPASGNAAIHGSGTLNAVPLFTDPTSISDSVITQNAGNVAIGWTSAPANLAVSGNLSAAGMTLGGNLNLTAPGSRIFFPDGTWLGSATGGTIMIPDGAVTTPKIADGAVTNAKLASSSIAVTPTAPLTGGGSVSLGGTLSLGLAAGDVTASSGATRVAGLRGVPVAPSTPTDGQVLRFNGAAGRWEPQGLGGVASVLAQAPLNSSGGATPTISLAGVVPIANGGTGMNAGPTAAGQFLRSSGAGVWSAGTITAGDLPGLSGAFVDLVSNQTVGGIKTFVGGGAGGSVRVDAGALSLRTTEGSGGDITVSPGATGGRVSILPVNSSGTPGGTVSLNNVLDVSSSDATLSGNLTVNGPSGRTSITNNSINLSDLAGNHGGAIRVGTASLAITSNDGAVGNADDLSLGAGAGNASSGGKGGDVHVLGGQGNGTNPGGTIFLSPGTGAPAGNVVIQGNMTVGGDVSLANPGSRILFSDGSSLGSATGFTISDGTVTTAKIADGAVTTPKIADGAVTNAKLASSSIAVTPTAPLTGGGSVSLGGTVSLGLAAGDVTASSGATRVAGLQGVPIAPSTPVDGQVLKFNAGMARWEPLGLGAVTSVLAQAPLNSSGGATPTISLAGVVPIANGGTGMNAGPTAAGQFLRSSGAGVWSAGTITAGDLPNLSGAFVDLVSNQIVGGIKTFVGGGSDGNVTISTGSLSVSGSGGSISLNPSTSPKLNISGGSGATTDISIQASTGASSGIGGQFMVTHPTGSPIALQLNASSPNSKLVAANGTGASSLTIDANANLATSGSVAIGGGTPIVKYLSATFALAAVSVPASSCVDRLFLFTGARNGDPIALGVPGGVASATGVQVTAFILASDTLTLRLCNFTAAAVATSGGTLRVSLLQH